MEEIVESRETMRRFEEKIALITGAARGIGRGIALCLAQEGAKIVVNDRANIEAAKATVKDIEDMGQEAIFWQADVTDRKAVAAMFVGVVERLGRIDVVVSNAAFSIREPVIEAKWEHLLRTLEVTQFGVFHVCQMAAQQMVK
jgi:glucose 1-dehydrogenase